MDKKEYLTEENYNKGKKKIKLIILIIVMIGFSISGFLLYKGFYYRSDAYKKILESKIVELEKDLEKETEKLRIEKKEIEESIKPEVDEIRRLESSYHGPLFTEEYYKNQDMIKEIKEKIMPEEKKIDHIDNYLEHAFCFDYKETEKVCDIDKNIKELKSKKEPDSLAFDSIPYFMGGFFVVFATIVFSIPIITIYKRREIAAFTIQQARPIAEETIDKVIPTLAKAGKTIAKEMAPEYGNIAKEISKGIKEGINEADKKDKK